MKQRFYPLDVFRGATVAFMILVNTPGSWSYIYSPLDHAHWHGCTPTDLVFPFFLFATGNALAFVMLRSGNTDAGSFRKKTAKRAVLIFLTGLFLSWFPFVSYDADGVLQLKSLEKLRIMGVLQRIAICYFFASILIYYLKSAGAFLAGIGLLLLYWAICLAWGGADPFSLEGWIGTAVDRSLLGETHMYHGEGVAFDPEGILSSIPAIVQVIFGYLIGDYIIQKKQQSSAHPSGDTLYPMIANLFVIAMLLIFTGLCWHMIFPINKKIWTSSYVVYTTGLAATILAMLISGIEIAKLNKRVTRFFDVFGKNPLFIFVLSGVSGRLYGLFRIADGMKDGKPVFKGLGGWIYDHFFVPPFGHMNGSLFYAIFHVLIFWVIARWLDKRKIYIKV